MNRFDFRSFLSNLGNSVVLEDGPEKIPTLCSIPALSMAEYTKVLSLGTL